MTNEFYTEAIVLDKEPSGEADLQIHLYTKELGRVTAKAVSARKIVSKLASHLEPLNIVQARLVQKNRMQVVDALETGSLPRTAGTVAILNLVKDLTGEGEADPELWNLLTGGNLNGEAALRALGFDNQFAVCVGCGERNPRRFLVKALEYSCSVCFTKFGSPASFVLE